MPDGTYPMVQIGLGVVSAGIGKALATNFVRSGDNVVICSRSGALHNLTHCMVTSDNEAA